MYTEENAERLFRELKNYANAITKQIKVIFIFNSLKLYVLVCTLDCKVSNNY